MSGEVQFNGKSVCDTCGKFGAFEFDGRMLCAKCYESCGSCCPEFGRDEKPEPEANLDSQNIKGE